MTRENPDIEQFWREKEEEHGSSFVMATPADYVRGYPALEPPVSGLLYMMRNGIYFENFPNVNGLFGLFQNNEPFTKIRLEFKKEDIVSVSCFHRQEDKRPLAFFQRFSLFFSPASQQLVITCMLSGRDCKVIFNCVKKPLLLCDAYDSM